MKPFSKSINWYPQNTFDSLKDDEPKELEEITPADTMSADTPAQETPNYPVTEGTGDELSVSEIKTDGDILKTEGDD